MGYISLMKRMLTTQQWYCMLHHDIYITGEQNLTEHIVLMDKKHTLKC